MILSTNQAVILGIIILILYVPVLVVIWWNQNKQAVYFKSPKMIMIGGINLMIDCLLNIYINTENALSNNAICVLSIFITLIFYFVAYFTIIFRAKRIFKVMGLTQKYLNRIYDLAKETHSVTGSDMGSRDISAN